jgi:flagellar biosynthesis/type III secretory pathway M-ring protein FliF/YscJ
VALDSDAVTTPEQVDALSRLAATAAGLDTNRGDVVTVSTMPFAAVAALQADDGAGFARQMELILSIARILAMLIAPIILLVAIRFILNRRGGPTDGRSGKDAAAILRATQEALPAPKAADIAQARLQQELSHLARTDPSAMAHVVRSWLQEDKALK